MKVTIKGKGHPADGGWEVCDENGQPIMLKRLEVDCEGVVLHLFEGLEVDLGVDARPICSKTAERCVVRGGKRFYFCAGHSATLRYLQHLGFFHFDFDITPLPAKQPCGYVEEAS